GEAADDGEEFVVAAGVVAARCDIAPKDEGGAAVVDHRDALVGAAVPRHHAGVGGQARLDEGLGFLDEADAEIVLDVVLRGLHRAGQYFEGEAVAAPGRGGGEAAGGAAQGPARRVVDAEGAVAVDVAV